MTSSTAVTHEPHTAPCAGGWAIGMGQGQADRFTSNSGSRFVACKINKNED
jgi:putrescine transport system substrate-binding protein